MQRWSRRSAASQSSKDKLKSILEEDSAQKDLLAGSVRQQIGDFYAACMDERGIDRLGIAPLRPYLEEIGGLKSITEVQQFMIRLHEIGIFVPFATGSSQDNHNPTQDIASISASGLGLRDRDYYLKLEERFKDARAKYLVHVANVFKLAGYDEARVSTWRAR